MTEKHSQHYSVDKKEVQAVHAAYLKLSEKSLLTFLRGLTVMGAQGKVLWNSTLAPFQIEFFEDLAPCLEAVRDGRKPPWRRFWLERTKKSSKDTDVAACILWLIAFSSRPILVQVCAANRAQAGIVEDRALSILHYNPWLNELLEVVGGTIRNKKMPREIVCRIEATSSGAGAQGPTPDLLVLNELVHVDRWSVMEAHMNNANGVPNGLVVVCTNAGVKGTPAHAWRENAKTATHRWACYIWDKKAPWLSDEDMEDARRMDPIGKEFARLWRGIWVGGSGDALDEDSINAVFELAGPQQGARTGWRHVAGLDLGISHDRAAVVVLAAHMAEQRVEVVAAQAWKPSIPNDKGVLEVDSEAVKKYCQKVSSLFRVEWFGYDPAAGGSFMAQALRKLNVAMREMTFTESNLTDMAVALVTAVKGRKLKSFEDVDGSIRRDLGKFNIEHKPPSSYRLKAISDEFGHADVGTALVICLPRALEFINVPLTMLTADDDVFADNDSELTDEEIASMPNDLLGIYDEDLIERAVRESIAKDKADQDDFSSLWNF